MSKNNSSHKAARISGFVFLMMLFVAAVVFGIYNFQDQTEDKEQETKKKEVSVKKSEKKIYEIGEDVETGDMVCNVLEAEIIDEFDKLDSYYQEGEYLVKPEEYAKSIYSGGNVFPEEVHFLHIKMSLENQGEKARGFSPADLEVSSILEEDAVPILPWTYFFTYDGQYMTENGEKRKEKFSGRKLGSDSFVSEGISIQQGETIIVDLVGEFYENMSEESFYDYDLYLQIYDTGKAVKTDPLGEKIHLKLERKYERQNNTGEPVLYEKVRDIAAMKSRSWTNFELSDEKELFSGNENMKEKILKHGEAGEEYSWTTSQDFQNDVLVQSYVKIIQPVDFQVTDWANLPENFAGQGSLESMAQRYQDVYGYAREDLKVLFLDIACSGDGVGKKYENGNMVCFYDCSKLIKADSDGKWKLFGTADDWVVMSNAKNPENIGRINAEQIGIGNTVTVRMAYILPPDFYQETEALYYSGGETVLSGEDITLTKILLKE